MREPAMHQPDSKSAEEKRRSREGKSDVGRTRVKMRDLQSLLRSEGIYDLPSKPLNCNAASDFLHCGMEVFSRVTDVRSGGSRSKVNDERDSLVVDKRQALFEPGLNFHHLSPSRLTSNEGLKQADEPKEVAMPPSLTQDNSSKVAAGSGGFSFDLNLEDVPTSTNQNPFYPYKNLDQPTVSECGSTTGPVEEKDPLMVWNAMKQNGLLSSSHGGIPVPKQNSRKRKNCTHEKQLELAKKEEVDRFVRIAAPSGLLNELNPGIINHVRNRKQVHAIIEALVKSERSANGNVEIQQPNNWKGRKDNVGCPRLISKSVSFESGEQCKDSNWEHLRGLVNKRFHLNPNTIFQEDDLALRLSLSTDEASHMPRSVPDENPLSFSSVDALSMRAARIASHWLGLMHRDIKARLTALQQSKRRVQEVIRAELPCLLSKKFSSNPVKHPYFGEETSAGCSNADIHRLKWTALFQKVEKELAEEGQKLEIWLSQVREMRRHCERGLQVAHCSMAQSVENHFPAEFSSRPGTAENSERELAMRAAAASIYSTCNFLLADEHASCC
ncbi:hypothetical protein MLD38_009715 [Melastoma candidum]|uniref:Uncharacterized protein n=1 Tax=Melastoma candidum TaxID=119954 RepID=A0ACB9S0E0_9MYRT|nr:hypothetical protein MLD38_009715 [Melastoma candidum]